jgi:two-component sensor histidine kinase
MFGKTRIRVAILILVVSVGTIAVVENYLLYRSTVEARSLVLRGTAEHWANIINSMIVIQRSYGVSDEKILESVCVIIDRTQENFSDFISSGEFILARKKGDQINILVAQRRKELPYPEFLPLNGQLALPARMALTEKEGGLVQGKDLRGRNVLAAYHPVGLLDLGVVVKIELRELRLRFIGAGIATMLISTFIICAGIIFIVVTERAAGRRLSLINEELTRENARRRETEIELQKANNDLLSMNEEVTIAIEELEATNEELVASQREIEDNYRELHDKETQIMNSLEEKEILLRELYHRTKNNMQVICGLLHLQSSDIDPATREVLRQTEDRIMSMALVHKKLYQSQSLAELPFDEYIRDLTSSIKESYHPSSDGVTINLNMERVLVAIETAVPCGLVLNELISNSFKHAFAECGSRSITIGLMGSGSGYLIEYFDSGKGLPVEMNPRTSKSLGCRLVFMIVENQLHGTVEYNPEEGVFWRIRIPFDEARSKSSMTPLL